MTKRNFIEIVSVLTRSGFTVGQIDAVTRLATSLARLVVDRENTPSKLFPASKTSRIRNIKDTITGIIAEVDPRMSVSFEGDPRGYPVHLHLPSGESNTLGGVESGYGIGETDGF